MSRKYFVILSILVALVYMGCASIGTPTGGPKDETPPVLLSSVPPANTTNFQKNKIEIYFDELISIKNAADKVVISPPQKKVPEVNAIMKKVVVEIKDSLLANETYTIDFTDAIVDYNENNPYGDYAFAFSTGSQIDTMCVSGYVLNAADLTPLKGIIVGAHADLSDSIFMQKPFLRISKTNDLGFFCIKNLKNIPYKIYALGDQNRDYTFDQKGEGIAFPDSAITLWAEVCQRYDTVWKDTTTIDTVMVSDITCFKPDDLVLKYFQEDFGRQYLVKSERSDRNKISIFFGYKSDTLPQLKLFMQDSIIDNEDWFVLEDNFTRDTLVYWLKDTLLAKMDTLKIQIDYLKSDSLNQLISTCDTLTLVAKKEPVKKTPRREKKKEIAKKTPLSIAQDTTLSAIQDSTMAAAQDSALIATQDSTLTVAQDSALTKAATPPQRPVTHLNVEAKFSSSMDVYEVPYLIWETPLAEIKGNPWHLYKKIDTLWVETAQFEIEQDDYQLRRHNIYADWEYEGEYKFEIDSGAVVGLYGFSNNKTTQTFKVKAEKDYSQLTVTIGGLDGKPAFLEVMNKNDKVVRKEEVINGEASCPNMKPGDYYLRVVLDENNNYYWDTGCYDEKRQPEMVFYHHKLITLKANWEINERWNIWERPISEQKPKELKPAKKK